MPHRQPTAEDMTRIWDLVSQLAQAHGAAPMTRWPAGWALELPDGWTICVNGQRQHVDWRSVSIAPFNMAVMHEDWLVGLVSPREAVVAAGSYLNTHTLIEALERALVEVRDVR